MNYDPCSGHGACAGIEWGYRDGDWKLMVGVADQPWYPVPGSDDADAVERPAAAFVAAATHQNAASGAVWWDEATYAASEGAVWLFNITADPEERVNLQSEHPDVVAAITAKVDAIVGGADYLAPCNVPGGSCYDQDPAGEAASKANGGWYPWK